VLLGDAGLTRSILAIGGRATDTESVSVRVPRVGVKGCECETVVVRVDETVGTDCDLVAVCGSLKLRVTGGVVCGTDVVTRSDKVREAAAFDTELVNVGVSVAAGTVRVSRWVIVRVASSVGDTGVREDDCVGPLFDSVRDTLNVGPRMRTIPPKTDESWLKPFRLQQNNAVGRDVSDDACGTFVQVPLGPDCVGPVLSGCPAIQFW
jgi:hypothetical protein